MKFHLNKIPEVGDIRVKSKYLLFPKSINREVRWLERAGWKDVYKAFPVIEGRGYSISYGWVSQEWIT